MKLKEWINIFVIVLLLGFSFYRFQNRTFSNQRTLLLLDTQIEIFVLSRSNHVDSLIEEAFQIIERYELLLSYHNSNSVLYKINQGSVSSSENGNKHPCPSTEGNMFEICEDFYAVLRMAEQIYYKSNHLYDVSIARLFDIWDFEEAVIPSDAEIEFARQYIGFGHIKFDANSLFLPTGFKLNFGSLAKGYIVDKVMEMLIESNVKEAFINAGGDIRFFSNYNRRWRVGIRHPRDLFSNIVVLNIPDMAVATSGDYERYFILDGTRYHHILNPSTGFPATPTISVTVLSPTAFLADALSTAALVMNPFDAIEMIRLFENTDAVIFFYDENDEPISLRTENIRRWIR